MHGRGRRYRMDGSAAGVGEGEAVAAGPGGGENESGGIGGEAYDNDSEAYFGVHESILLAIGVGDHTASARPIC